MEIIMYFNYMKYWLIYLLIINIQVREDIGVATATTYIPTNASFEPTSQTLVTTSSTSIYVIIGYNDPYTTMQTSLYPVTSEVTSTSTTFTTITTYFTNGIYVINSFSDLSITTTTQPITSINTTTSTTTSTSTTTQFYCNPATQVWYNGSCVNRSLLINASLSVINSTSASSTEKANAISTYITAVSNTTMSSTFSNLLPIGQLNQVLGNLTSFNYSVITNDSIIVITKPDPCNNNITILGASTLTNSISKIINNKNKDNVINSILSAAGYINQLDQCNQISINYFNMLIINDPTIYQNSDNSSNRTLVSSIIIATIAIQGNDVDTNHEKAVGNSDNVVIDLYFQAKTKPDPNDEGTYLCTFFDTNSSQWNDSGCGKPTFNSILNRYKCRCYHLTSFALIWLSNLRQPINNNTVPNVKYDAQDIASLVFQFISILCFLGIISHGIVIRVLHPGKYHLTHQLLPVISCGVTMILFIFFITLGLTVYTRYVGTNSNINNSTNQGRILEIAHQSEQMSRMDNSSGYSTQPYIRCLSNEYGLMFTVYFFLILMFCTKTSIGIDNYRRYVQLFPPPTFRMLIILMIISILISILLVSIPAALNADPSKQIAGIHLYKLCWFTPNVIHYFLTLPTCIFLVINLFMFIPVVKENITHAAIKEDKKDGPITDEDRHYYIRRKRCIYVILSSCVTQGIGWLFGPLILIAANENAANVLGWFFIIFNGLEGLWAIILYIIVKDMHIDERRQYQSPDIPCQLDDIDLIDTQDNEGGHKPLTDVRSDSPRNSFTDLAFELRARPNANRDNDNESF